MCARPKTKESVSMPSLDVCDITEKDPVEVIPGITAPYEFPMVPRGYVQAIVTKEELSAIERDGRLYGYHGPSKTALYKKEQ